MTRTILGTLVAVFAGAAMVAAQGQPPSSSSPSPSSQSPSSQSSQSSASSQRSQTFTGCLEEGATPGTYVLSNVSDAAKSGVSAAGEAAGQAQAGQAAAGAAKSGEQYTLSGTPSGFDFKANLNHRVQITGTLASASSSASSSGPRPGEAMSSSSSMKSITVASAKSVSDRCSVQ